MSRIRIVSIVIAALFLTAFVVVQAEARGRHGWRGHRWHHGGPMRYIAHELKLSDAQKVQIHQLWEAERPTVSAELHELLADDRQMNAIAESSQPDEGAIRTAADREAKTIAALLVEKARLESKIDTTVLNPDQRAKADELRVKWESRLDHVADLLGTQAPR